MSKNNRTNRMRRVWVKRGRTPLKSTMKEVFLKIERISQGGVKHINLKKVIMAK